MTQQLLQTYWCDIRSDCRCYWGKLTEEDIERIGADFGAFVQALCRRYGYSPLKAEDELERFLFRYGGSPQSVAAPALAEAQV